MKILIETKNLIDSPYTPSKGNIFHFDNEKVDGLVSEILYGSPTCYLVSGYRGAGKTSFLRRVEERCKEENSKNKNTQRLIFVHSNFSRFENRTNFLRKVIRDLQETITEEQKNATGNAVNDLKGLYKKTFYAVKHEHAKSIEGELTNKVSLDVSDFWIKILKKAGPLLATFIVNPLYSFIPASWGLQPFELLIKIIAYLIPVAISFFGIFKITSEYTIKRTWSSKSSEESLTDDDIINYYLERLIDRFQTENFRLIFVLDELDKIDDEEIKSLLKEMKPWLVRGKADFVIVAGQKLTMQYYQLRDSDDELLASLFSKVVHINLLPEYNFERIFNDFLFKGISNNDTDSFVQKSYNELTDEEANSVIVLRDHYIYRSKRLPRTFMNLVRQDLRWKGQEAFLDIPANKYECERKKWEILKNLVEKVSLNAEIPETAKDYISMYLYRIADGIDCSDNFFITSPDPPKDYPYLNDFMTDFRDEFVATSERNGIIKLKKQITPSDETHKEQKNEQPQEDRKLPQEEKITKQDIKPAQEEKAHPTKTFTKQLENFKKDFLFLFDTLISYYQFFYPVKVKSPVKESFRNLTTVYRKRRVFLFPDIDDPLLEKNFEYFQSRQGDIETVENLNSLFERHSIRIASLLESIFREFTIKTIKANFPGKFYSGQEIKPSMREFAHFAIERDEGKSTALSVIFRYQYIDGPISVSHDDVAKLASYLDEFNIISLKGNYIVQILFSRDNNIDFEKEEVNAALKLKSIRADLTDKIRYIILPTVWANDFKARLSKLWGLLTPYEIVPALDNTLAKEKSKKGKKKLSSPSASNADEKIIDPDDIQKGRWGGKTEVNFRKISAKVVEDKNDKNWFYVDLKVESTKAKSPLTGKVTFYLHDSFRPNEYTVIAKNNEAELTGLGCYEAFTVGATCDNNTTQLEIDLNGLSDAPDGFKY